MSVGILLVTHQSLGSALLRVARGIFGTCPTEVQCLEVENDAPREVRLGEARRLIERLDTGEGVLVLTDLYGSTPANVARDLLDEGGRIRLLAGVNVPMLVRALSYAGLDLDSVAEKALMGGRDGVLACANPAETD